MLNLDNVHICYEQIQCAEATDASFHLAKANPRLTRCDELFKLAREKVIEWIPI